MKILDFLSRDSLIPSLNATDKEGVLKELTSLLVTNNSIADGESVFQALMERERLGSTGIGDSIAIPHAKTASVDTLVAAFGRSEAGVEYYSVDDKPARFIFMLLAAETATGTHLKALARVSRLLKSEGFRQTVEKAADIDEIFEAIEEVDRNLD